MIRTIRGRGYRFDAAVTLSPATNPPASVSDSSASPRDKARARRTTDAAEPFVLLLSNGRRITVPASFDEATLLRLVAALERSG
jgi:hypothetical protein